MKVDDNLNLTKDNQIIQLEKEINELKNQLNKKDIEIKSFKEELIKLEAKNEQLKSFKEEVYHSNSWKLTKPLRMFKS